MTRTGLRQLFFGFLVFVLGTGNSPESVLRLMPQADSATAQARAGGGRAGGGRAHVRPGGARSGPAMRPRPSAPATRPAAPRPAPATRPAPTTRPAQSRPVTVPTTRPATGVQRPVGTPTTRPAKPGAGVPGATRPVTLPGRPPDAGLPGNRPPGARPPGSRPPGARPPGDRPPGWRPPHVRPPNYRPPYYRPPYYRPPHYIWGPYYWGPSWGWYYTAVVFGSTLVYTTSLPEEQACEEFQDADETLYLCDGVLYRATYYQNEMVFEIVSEPGGAAAPTEPETVVGLGLTSPMTQGVLVRDLQNRLVALGYDVGGVDGVFGAGTLTALEWYQSDNEIDVTGVVDTITAARLGF